MFAVNTFEEIEKKQREINKEQIIILLFMRPTVSGAAEMIDEFDYIHYNSGESCSIYAIGYSNDFGISNNRSDYKKVTKVGENAWFFSNLEFVKFKRSLEERINWSYSGEAELLVLQSNPAGKQILNFQNYGVVDINYGLQKGYISSFSRLMEALVRSSQEEIMALDVMKKVFRKRLSIRQTVFRALEDCKRVPASITEILKDRMFYHSLIRK